MKSKKDLEGEIRKIEIAESLLPRRREIYETVYDHSPCSADFIFRRFNGIPRRTIHYDLQQLQRVGLIKKLGSTRGALYTAT